MDKLGVKRSFGWESSSLPLLYMAEAVEKMEKEIKREKKVS